MATPQSRKTPIMTTTTRGIPGLGSISGISYENGECVQYLGIPYADIPGRFRKSVPAREPWPGNRWDGTKLGPYCPQPPRDFYPVPNPPERTWLNNPSTNELQCLNLNISVPKHEASSPDPLPVLVFLHGGAFTYSTGSSPIYDGRILATCSALDSGTPTIVITLNYRLGVYGFLGGTDIQAYAEAYGEQGCGNYGIWDQVLALRWIKRHIDSFGGDADHVTIMGQSAGSTSVACHMFRGEALFEKAIMQSGVLALCRIFTPNEYQVVFEKMLVECGISLELGPVARVEALAAVPEDTLTEAMMPVFEIPVITMALCDDGVLLPRMSYFADFKNFGVPSFVNGLMVGDALNECIIWNKSWNHLSATELLDIMHMYLGDKTQRVAQLYGIKPHLSAKETFDAIERMTTDGLYCIPNYMAKMAHPQCYAYHFNVPSPYDNPWKGLSHHSFDNVLIFRVLKHTLPPEQQVISQEMASMWIKFANNIEPWERFDENQKLCVFGPDRVRLMSKDTYQSQSYKAWEILEREELVGPLSRLSCELCLHTKSLLAPVRQ